ncbi:hypothetical protein RDp07_gp75 [Roseobacter phage RD-1410Ws-07]|uniref:Uncharacterized protein n=1 Tax=Roseobacter phage RD-1410Ws-07 TaxID=1815985 RepID=A0A191VYV0_9CAUD|nr:hypothetical protein RDp07_gp75 [Roseobacter phage RD-1410Ws-07]
MTREDMEAYNRQAWENGCENPKNMDRWGIRDPLPEEIAEHGVGIMVFEYYNSPQGCSNSTEMGIWHEGQRWGLMKVTTGGEEVNHNEEIEFRVEDMPYTAHGHNFLLVPDAKEPHTIILFPFTS